MGKGTYVSPRVMNSNFRTIWLDGPTEKEGVFIGVHRRNHDIDAWLEAEFVDAPALRRDIHKRDTALRCVER